MRLADALLYVELDEVPPGDLRAFCEAAVAGGVDVFHAGVGLQSHWETLKTVCEAQDALLIVEGASMAEAGVTGYLARDLSASFGVARSWGGGMSVVGVRVETANDAALAIELGADFILYAGGVETASVMAALPGATGQAVYAGPLRSLDEAAAVVETGIHRLWLSLTALAPSVDEVRQTFAAYSRLLGRIC